MASMTVGEVRDRLDQRFRLLVGSRRGLERHHTLRHAVAWSYDLAYKVQRRAVMLARDSGNQQMEMAAAVSVSAFAAAEGDPIEAFDYLTTIIRRYHDSGNVSLLQYPMPILAALFDRVGHHEQAATICGFTRTAMARAAFPEIDTTITHLREVLGDQVYESLAHKGEAMTTAAMATYALDQIDQARAELNAVSK